MADARFLDGDGGFPGGVNSTVDADSLPPGALARAFNLVTRGGILQARPGFDQVNVFPDGNFQGGTIFRPSGSPAQVLFAIAGKIYVSQAPFELYHRIPGLQFDENASNLYFEPNAQQAVSVNDDGSLKVIDPRNYCIIQDGLTKAASWDGSAGVHRDDVPLGTVMCWSGERLWVARGNRLFASDYANPFGYAEGKYIGSTGAFVFPGPITAIARSISMGSPFMLVFTLDCTYSVNTSVRNRDAWNSTQGFIYDLFPKIGCVGHRAWTLHNGKLWWFAAQGLTNMDFAQQAYVTSTFPYVDTPMSYSKRFLAEDLSGVALASVENYLLVSVPYADKFNRHTWVLDSSSGSGSTADIAAGAGWQGVWTGIRPVEWLTGTINDEFRSLALSVDRDGKNRMWDTFRPSRRDNGCPFWWGFETRGYGQKDKSRSRFRYVDFVMSEVEGDDFFIKVQYAGTGRGPYKTIGLKKFTAVRGSIAYDEQIDAEQDCVYAMRKQSRDWRTQDATAQDPEVLGSCGVESDRIDVEDRAFQLCVSCLGPGAVRYIRVWGEPQTEKRSGICDPDDSPFRGSRFDGSGHSANTKAEVIEALCADLGVHSASATAAAAYRGVTAVGTATQTSGISAEAAQMLAVEVARMRVTKRLEQTAPGYLGGASAC